MSVRAGLTDPPPGPPQHLDPPRLACEVVAVAEAAPGIPEPSPEGSELDLRECLRAASLLVRGCISGQKEPLLCLCIT